MNRKIISGDLAPTRPRNDNADTWATKSFANRIGSILNSFGSEVGWPGCCQNPISGFLDAPKIISGDSAPTRPRNDAPDVWVILWGTIRIGVILNSFGLEVGRPGHGRNPISGFPDAPKINLGDSAQTGARNNALDMWGIV